MNEDIPGHDIDLSCFVRPDKKNMGRRRALIELWPEIAARAFAGEATPGEDAVVGHIDFEGALEGVTYADLKAQLGDPWAVASRDGAPSEDGAR